MPDLVMLKRVIGLPGDAVEQVGGVVRVNGEVLREPYVIEDPRTLGSWDVDQGHVFVMGDDRPNSNDSRFSLGQISMSDIVGKVLLQRAPASQASAPPAPAVSGSGRTMTTVEEEGE